MKKTLLTFTLIAFIMFGTMSGAIAKPETFYVKITLSDTCSPGNYHGYYCVQVTLTYNGSPVCTTQNCTVVPGTFCYPFTCEFAPVSGQPYYGVTLVAAARYPSGNCYITSGSTSNGFPWNDMADSGCIAASFTIIL